MTFSKNSIHIVTQAKGGVGKSFISRLLAQYLQEKLKVFCFDADPLNDGLVAFQGLNARKLKAKLINGNLDSRTYFDPLFETILLTDCCFVIDSGSSTHINFINYIKNSDILNLCKEANKEVFFHIPLSGNVEFDDCFKELINRAEQFSTSKFIVWENEFSGEIGQDYRKDNDYQALTNILGTVKLKNLQSSPLLLDLELMNKHKLLFNEINANGNLFGTIVRRRLNLYKDHIFQQLDNIIDSEKD